MPKKVPSHHDTLVVAQMPALLGLGVALDVGTAEAPFDAFGYRFSVAETSGVSAIAVVVDPREVNHRVACINSGQGCDEIVNEEETLTFQAVYCILDASWSSRSLMATSGPTHCASCVGRDAHIRLASPFVL